MLIDLTTERLLLRCIGYDDADFFYRQFSNDDVNRYLYDAEPCVSKEEAKEWIGFYLEPEPRNQHRWILVLKSTGESIGTCGFHCWNRKSGEAEIGYDLFPTYQRQGYMMEVLKKIIEFAKETMRVNKVYAHISADNRASIKLAEKQGFIKTDDSYYEEYHGEKYLHDVYLKSL